MCYAEKHALVICSLSFIIEFRWANKYSWRESGRATYLQRKVICKKWEESSIIICKVSSFSKAFGGGELSKTEPSEVMKREGRQARGSTIVVSGLMEQASCLLHLKSCWLGVMILSNGDGGTRHGNVSTCRVSRRTEKSLFTQNRKAFL